MERSGRTDGDSDADEAVEAASTEYGANFDPGDEPAEGYVGEGEPDAPRAADLDPHEPPGQG